MRTKVTQFESTQRRKLLMGLFVLMVFALLFRVAELHIWQKDFLQGQGDSRFLRDVSIPGTRGMITDRNGEPLAISTPVDSVWVHPGELFAVRDQWARLSKTIGITEKRLAELLKGREKKEFVYLRRHIAPDVAASIETLNIPGVFLQREYRRYYPSGEVTAHVVGFTDVDDMGQEGAELALNARLQGADGSKRVIKDRLGRIVENVEQLQAAQPGEDLALSIDRRIQYLAYRELKSAVQKHRARSASAVIMDVQTGEVLAMVNQPAYNPNNRSEMLSSHYRNRAVTDLFEPGSTIKPFTVLAGLESGQFTAESLLDTTPGYMKVGNTTVRDFRDYGEIDLPTVLQKSSNVGVSKISLALGPERMWNMFAELGFGANTGSLFPGEQDGSLTDYGSWHDVEQATLAFGYGLAVTPLQLVRAYAALANGGYLVPVRLLKAKKDGVDKRSIFRPVNVQQVRKMLELVVEKGGTGTRAQVSGYRVAGKTGTVKKLGSGGYKENSYLSLFAGVIPASAPRLAMVVIVDDPQGEDYYGGKVAAPIFSKVMAGAARLLNIPPDNLEQPAVHMAMLGGHR